MMIFIFNEEVGGGGSIPESTNLNLIGISRNSTYPYTIASNLGVFLADPTF